MLFNDLLILESLILIVTFNYLTNNNLTSILYLAGVYLVLAGVISLINDFGIYIGFLWVIDLGVGLVFFIFILHFTTFLSQKNTTYSSFKLKNLLFVIILLTYAFIYSSPQSGNTTQDYRFWSFNVNYLDYYKILNSFEITDLQTMKENYFIINSFEFYIINFSLFFGLISSILLMFLIHRIFNILNYNSVIFNKLLDKNTTNFYVRNQNFIIQQNTTMSVRTWSKKRPKKL